MGSRPLDGIQVAPLDSIRDALSDLAHGWEVLHFSCHGLPDARSSDETSLVLSSGEHLSPTTSPTGMRSASSPELIRSAWSSYPTLNLDAAAWPNVDTQPLRKSPRPSVGSTAARSLRGWMSARAGQIHSAPTSSFGLPRSRVKVKTS